MIAVYFLDVGQGDCSVIVPRWKAPILFDCSDAYVAERFLKSRKIRRLSAAVVSHLDEDHIGGMLTFLEGFFRDGGRLDSLYIGLDRSPPDLSKEAKFLLSRSLEWNNEKRFALRIPVREAEPKTILRGFGWEIRLVLPYYGEALRMQVDQSVNPNRNSAVLRVDYGEGSVLIGSDAPLRSWKMLRETGLLRSNVFRIPHHGGRLGRAEEEQSAEWGRAGLYQAVNAKVAVCSVGTANRYDHPFPEHLRDVRRGGECRLLCTQLSAQCHARPLQLRERLLEACSTVSYPYRHRLASQETAKKSGSTDEVPCAGSVLVELHSRGRIRVEPAPGGWHDRAVGGMSSPMCR